MPIRQTQNPQYAMKRDLPGGLKATKITALKENVKMKMLNFFLISKPPSFRAPVTPYYSDL